MTNGVAVGPHQEILQALRTADAYRKLSLAYVEGILRKRYEQKG